MVRDGYAPGAKSRASGLSQTKWQNEAIRRSEFGLALADADRDH
jgi:hypothetical protein